MEECNNAESFVYICKIILQRCIWYFKKVFIVSCFLFPGGGSGKLMQNWNDLKFLGENIFILQISLEACMYVLVLAYRPNKYRREYASIIVRSHRAKFKCSKCEKLLCAALFTVTGCILI